MPCQLQRFTITDVVVNNALVKMHEVVVMASFYFILPVIFGTRSTWLRMRTI
jgi:hypothetical protein